jgi:outer membrane protein TolC
VRVRYENSLSPFVDLLDAQLNLDIARVQVIARKNELITAIARLNLESGTLFKELGINNDPGNMIE